MAAISSVVGTGSVPQIQNRSGLAPFTPLHISLFSPTRYFLLSNFNLLILSSLEKV